MPSLAQGCRAKASGLVLAALLALSAPSGAEPTPKKDAPGPDPDDAEVTGKLRYSLEGIEIRGNRRTAPRVILRYVPFKVGDVLDVSDPEFELTRFRLLATGFFSAARLSLKKGSKRGAVVLVVHVVERNTIIVENVAMGIAADEDAEGNSEPISPYFALQVAETNLAGTGITLGAGVAAAADQFAIEARFGDPAVVGTPWMISAALRYVNARDFFGNKEVSFESPNLEQRSVTDYAVVDYTRFGGTVGVGYELSSATRVFLDYNLERVDAIVPTAASHVRGETREPIDFDILPGGSVLSSLRVALTYDTRDAPFLPTHGSLGSIRGTLGAPPLGSSYSYQKLEAGWTTWWRLPWRHVIGLETRIGAVAGDAPFFEKFYVGDFTDLLPGRILGLNPDRRQPPNYFGTDIVEVRYGDYAARLATEYRIPLYSGRGSIYGIDFFAGGGLYGAATSRELDDPPSGYEGAERIPIDLTYNLGLRIETYVGGFSVAFSNLLGLLPARGGGRK